jgi:hypothetical protein
MSPDKQRIAIAQACGVVSKDHWGHLYKTEQGYARDCPDYVYDLNAMHEAEKVLTGRQRPFYAIELLGHGSSQSSYWENHALDMFEAATTTASQRAKAFLRTVGKWEEDK